jgi:hypothetical protein
MLLSNTAGFTNEAPLGNDFLWRCNSKQEHLNSIRDSWLKFPVNTNWSYGSSGFDIAAEVIEKVSGMNFESYVQQKILNPLHMKYSTLDDNEVLANKNRTEGDVNVFVKKTHYKIPYLGAGAIYSNIDEMIKYVQFHLNFGSLNGKQIIEKKYLKEMYTVYRNSYGFGLEICQTTIKDTNNTFFMDHSGGGYGFASKMTWYPEYNLGFVILGNKMFFSNEYMQISIKIISDFILNNENVIKSKKVDVHLVSESKPKEKVKQKPTFIYSTNNENKKEINNYNIVGKYEVVFDRKDSKWFAKIVTTLGVKPITLSVAMNDSVPVMNGFFGKGKLKEYIPGLYFIDTDDGYEAFDIRNGVATYGNIKLRKYSDK